MKRGGVECSGVGVGDGFPVRLPVRVVEGRFVMVQLIMRLCFVFSGCLDLFEFLRGGL